MIFDNILPETEHRALVNLITSLDFPWYYQPNIAFLYDQNSYQDPNRIESFGLTHTVWDIEKGKVSEALSYVEPVVRYFQEISKIKINNFVRIKINLQTPIPSNDLNKYNGAHVDRYVDHKVLVYYPLDSDGDFFIFNELFNENDQNTFPSQVVPTVMKRIPPKENRLILLDTGFRYHSSSNPINYSKRYSINFNFN